jgi:hypothetical protein
MSRVRSERGQTAAEYLGVLLLVGAIVMTVVNGSIGHTISTEMSRIVRCIGVNPCTASITDPGVTPPAIPPTTMPPSGGPPAAGGIVPWTSGQARGLPRGGTRPYVPPKKARGNPMKVPAGGRGGSTGFIDKDGNIWVWAPPGVRHGGDHWDVQHNGGKDHTNVDPEGNVIGPDRFPNAPSGGDGDGGGGGGDDHTAEIVGGAATGIGLGGAIWWGAKVLSPACGPFAPACAVIL